MGVFILTQGYFMLSQKGYAVAMLRRVLPPEEQR
jgi:hypothetical protein